MEIAVKISLVLLAMALLPIFLGGCSAPRVRGDADLFKAYARPDRNYFADRGYDLLDIVSASIEWPVIGATVTLGPAKVGLMASSHPTLEGKGGVGIGLATERRLTGFGLRCGQIGTYVQEENVLGFAWDTPPDYGDATRAYLRKKTGRVGDRGYSRRPLYARAGAAVGLGVGVRLELNVGEFSDFLLGVVGIDFMHDDLGRRLVGSKSLGMSYADLDSLPAEIGDFPELKTLNLESNRLQELPETFSRLRALQDLNLAANRFTKFPEVLASLDQIKSLHLGKNQIEGTLSSSIGSLSSLEKLTLYGNQLQLLPDEVGNLRKLEKLWLDGNQLESLPATIGGLEHLQELQVENNRLKSLPPTIGAAPLHELILTGNWLESIPPELGNIQYLRVLDLGKNQLHQLPPELGRLQYLEILSLGENQLHTLQPEFAGLRRLTSSIWRATPWAQFLLQSLP